MMNPSILLRALLFVQLLGLQQNLCEAAESNPPPRPTAATLRSATAAPLLVDARGFIRRWWVQDPVPTNGLLTQLAVDQTVKNAGDAASMSGSAQAMDTLRYNFNLYHFAWALSKPTSNVLFWIATVVDVPADVDDARLAIGSNAASIWWLDGERIISLYNDRQSVIDDGVSKRLRLGKGRHVIRAAILNGGGATDFCARFLDSNYRPLTTVTSPPASVQPWGRPAASAYNR